MRSPSFLQLPIILLTFILSPSPLLPRPPASCSPYTAPLLISYGYTQYPSAHTIVLTAVFNPDDLIIDRTFYTVNGRSWLTDIIPGDATCPEQIQAFLGYTLDTLNTGSPPFLYIQGHNLAAYTDFLRRTHHLCGEQAMQQTGCRLRHLYLPVLRVGE